MPCIVCPPTVHHRARTHLGHLPVAFNFARAFANDQKLLFGMLVRRMRTRARIKNARSCRNSAQLIGWTVVINEGFLAFHNHRRRGAHIEYAFGKFFRRKFGSDCAVCNSHAFNI